MCGGRGKAAPVPMATRRAVRQGLGGRASRQQQNTLPYIYSAWHLVPLRHILKVGFSHFPPGWRAGKVGGVPPRGMPGLMLIGPDGGSDPQGEGGTHPNSCMSEMTDFPSGANGTHLGRWGRRRPTQTVVKEGIHLSPKQSPYIHPSRAADPVAPNYMPPRGGGHVVGRGGRGNFLDY